jgi:hypothetical protein
MRRWPAGLSLDVATFNSSLTSYLLSGAYLDGGRKESLLEKAQRLVVTLNRETKKRGMRTPIAIAAGVIFAIVATTLFSVEVAAGKPMKAPTVAGGMTDVTPPFVSCHHFALSMQLPRCSRSANPTQNHWDGCFRNILRRL